MGGCQPRRNTILLLPKTATEGHMASEASRRAGETCWGGRVASPSVDNAWRWSCVVCADPSVDMHSNSCASEMCGPREVRRRDTCERYKWPGPPQRSTYHTQVGQ